jgi:hypothetical protein
MKCPLLPSGLRDGFMASVLVVGRIKGRLSREEVSLWFVFGPAMGSRDAAWSKPRPSSAVASRTEDTGLEWLALQFVALV